MRARSPGNTENLFFCVFGASTCILCVLFFFQLVSAAFFRPVLTLPCSDFKFLSCLPYLVWVDGEFEVWIRKLELVGRWLWMMVGKDNTHRKKFLSIFVWIEIFCSKIGVVYEKEELGARLCP